MRQQRYKIRLSPSNKIPAFFMKLRSERVKLLSIVTDEDYTYFTTDRKGLKNARKYRRRYRLKLKIQPHMTDVRFTRIIGTYYFFILLVIPFLCSFFLWTVTVESEVPEMTARIEKKLQEASIVSFRPLMKIPDETTIRSYLMQDDPSLSWVYFKRSGAVLTVIPMRSPSLEQKVDGKEKASDLVARTGGVVTKFSLTKGERVARLFSTVKKGELLATGVLEQGEKEVVVGAEGKVFADYWIEYDFSIPTEIYYDVQGNEEIRFSLHAPWEGDRLFNLENWNIIETERVVEKINMKMTIQEGMEESFIIPMLKMKLLREVGPEATIKEEKILHVTYDDDKVKGTILFFMNDNIAIKRPIHQGD